MEATEVRKLAELEQQHWWYRERRYLLRRMIKDTLGQHVEGRIAVDVGAAAGGNTRLLRAMGLAAYPLEYTREGAIVARERGLPVVRGDAARLPFASTSVDTVVAFDVLEHIEDDRGVAREFQRVLRPDGVLLLAVPADMKLWSAHDVAVGHVRRYSRHELVSLVESAGFHVERLRAWNVLLRPIVARRRASSRGSDLVRLNPAVNSALRTIIAAERCLPILREGRGVSLLLSARRTSI